MLRCIRSLAIVLILIACSLDLVDVAEEAVGPARASISYSELVDSVDDSLVNRSLAASLEPGWGPEGRRELRVHTLRVESETLPPLQADPARLTWSYEKTEPGDSLEMWSVTFPGLDSAPQLNVHLPTVTSTGLRIDASSDEVAFELALAVTNNLHLESGSWTLAISPASDPGRTLVVIHAEGLPPDEIRLSRSLLPDPAAATLTIVGIWSRDDASGSLVRARLNVRLERMFVLE